MCGSSSNAALQDTGTADAVVGQSQPVTNGSDFWGVDTGQTPSGAGGCGGFSSRSYSGDGNYAPLSEAGCGSNIHTEIGVTGNPNDFSSAVWFVVVPSVPFTDACHPTGTLSVSTTGPVIPSSAHSYPSVTLADWVRGPWAAERRSTRTRITGG